MRTTKLHLKINNQNSPFAEYFSELILTRCKILIVLEAGNLSCDTTIRSGLILPLWIQLLHSAAVAIASWGCQDQKLKVADVDLKMYLLWTPG